MREEIKQGIRDLIREKNSEGGLEFGGFR